MKRMKKKVVAMVTLAMFMLSMVPMAAFAANPKYNLNNSSVELELENPTVEVGETAKITIDAQDVTGATIGAATDNDLYVWFEKEGAVVYDSIDFSAGTPSYMNNNSAVKLNGAQTELTATFKEAGTYTLHAGVSASTAAVTDSENLVGEIKVPDTKNTVTVTAKDFPAASVAGTAVVSVPVDKQNGIETVSGTIKVTANNENVIPARTPIKFVNSYEKEGLTILNAKDEETTTLYTAAEITTGNNQNVTFKVKVAPNTIPGRYTYNIECNDAKGTVVVNVLSDKDDTKAATIKAVPVETVIDSQSSDAAKSIAFEVRNADGQLIDIANAGEPMVADQADGFNKVNYVSITGPNGAKVSVTNVSFEQDSETKNTVMKMTSGDFDDVFTKDGEYTVKVTLKNGQSATSTFTVDKFAGAEEIVIEPAKETGSNVVLNDSVGSKFDVYAVDKNGVKSKLDSDNYTLAYSPVAKDVNVELVETPSQPSVIKASIDNTVDKNDVLGTKIAVTAMYKDAANNTLFATHDFTVVDKTMLTDYELSFDKTEGKALSITEVTPSIVKKSDKDAKLEVKEVYAKVLSSTNKDAVVNVKVDGKKINVYSDKDTSLEIQVIVTSTQGHSDVVYSGTLTFNVGKTGEQQAEKKLVAVTVGSSDYIVNNEVVKGDAAPYIKDNRTFVPVRAVTEALGAEVVYNAADNTVTVELDGTTVVMTIGSKDYTVDGEKKTMDVAPEAKAGRTYLPGRFLGEAFGFSVNPLTSTTGDVTVVFTK